MCIDWLGNSEVTLYIKSYMHSVYTDSEEEPFFNVTINNAVPFQPAITLEVTSHTYREDNGQFTNVDGEGYVIGYRDCSSNSTELCYGYITPVSLTME